MRRILVFALLACGSASLSFAGSIFFSSNGGANVQLILNGGAPIDSFDSGWYTNSGTHNPTNDNYITGLCTGCGGETFRSFFVFNIPSEILITSAVLNLNTFTYDSLLASETLDLFDVSTSLASLLAGTGGLGAYDDLGSGATYGSRVYTAPDGGLFRTITLNAAAIAAIQAASDGSGSFVMGGALADQAVPEPSAILLLSLPLGLLAWRRRRKQ